MSEVDFSDSLWLFASPWSEERIDRGDRMDDLGAAWVDLWNYSVDPTSIGLEDLRETCRGMIDIPLDELVEILSKRLEAFFPGDNRVITEHRVKYGFDDFYVYVTFAEPIQQPSSKGSRVSKLWTSLGFRKS